MKLTEAMSGMAQPKSRPGGGQGGKPAAHEGAEPSELHDHGDGTFHTVTSDGQRTEHPHIGHALMHLAAHHDGGSKHMHAHHDGTEYTTHHVGEDGEVQGPHNHENIEALKDHLGQFFNEEENEGGGYPKGKESIFD